MLIELFSPGMVGEVIDAFPINQQGVYESELSDVQQNLLVRSRALADGLENVDVGLDFLVLSFW